MVKTRELADESQRVRWNIKDSIFISFFREAENVLKLYQETHPEDTDVTLSDIKLNTLSNVVASGPVNDLGFIVKDKMLFLVEAQSYYLPSVLLRSFFYLMHTLERYLKSKGIDPNYADKEDVPEWILYVIFTKGSRHKDRDEMLAFDSISSDFFDLSNGRIIELKEGGIIDQYLEVCGIIDRIITEKGHGKDSIERIFDLCTEVQGEIGKYIQSRKVEIMGFYEDMFEQEAATESRIRHEVKIAVQEAKEEAEKEAQQQKIKTAQVLIADGTVSDELISKATGLSMGEISALREQS